MYTLLILILTSTPNPCTVRINAADRDGSGSKGTGALVATDLIMTANHVVKDRKDTVMVTFPNGRIVEGTVIKVDAAQDIAAIKITPVGIAPLKIGEMPNNGDKLSIEGYGGKGFAACTGTLSPKRYGQQKEKWRQIDGCQARSGDSGGPVLNEKGEFVGVLWGSDKGETLFTAIDIVRDFLPDVPDVPIIPPYIIW